MAREEKVHRFHVEMTESTLRELDEFKELGGATTRKEVLNTAIAALRWMIREKQDGAVIVAVHDDSNSERELVLPMLERIRARTTAEPRRESRSTRAAGRGKVAAAATAG